MENSLNHANWKSQMAAIAAIAKTNFWLLHQMVRQFELKDIIATGSKIAKIVSVRKSIFDISSQTTLPIKSKLMMEQQADQ